MRPLTPTLLVATLFAPGALWSADNPSFRVLTDVSKIPDPAVYARTAKTLCEEWYPRINAILYDEKHALPYPEIRIVFANVVVYATESTREKVPAMAEGDTIWVSWDYTSSYYHPSLPGRWPHGFEAMIIHELTHILQSYPNLPANAGWLNEGIADYVRHKYFENDLEAKLRLDARGFLKGYSSEEPFFALQESKANLAQQGYRQGYTVASAFLLWLEQRKDPDIVRKLNAALSTGGYSDRLFAERCGSSLDALWKEFFQQNKPSAR